MVPSASIARLAWAPTLSPHSALLATVLLTLPASLSGQEDKHERDAPRKPASEAEVLVLQLANPKLRRLAQARLCVLGKKAVPALVYALRIGWKVPDYYDVTRTYRAAYQILQQMGPEAVASVPALRTMLGDRWRMENYPDLVRTIQLVAPFGREEGKKLREIFRSRLAAARQFGGRVHWGSVQSALLVHGWGPLRDLRYQLRNENPYQIFAICNVLGHRAGDLRRDPVLAKQVATTLVEHLKKDRGQATRISWSYDDARYDGLDRLSYFQIVSAAATKALARLDPRHPESVPGHIQLLQSIDTRERARAAIDLGILGVKAAAAVIPLCNALHDPNHRVRANALTALGMIGPKAKVAIPTLRRLAKGKASRGLAARATAALKQIGSKHDDVWTHWHETGKKKSEGRVKDGKAEGRWVFWWPHGLKRAEGDYVGGKESGTWRYYWHHNGARQAEGRMVKGRAEGYWRWWTLSGTVWQRNTGTYQSGERISPRDLTGELQKEDRAKAKGKDKDKDKGGGNDGA